ncbi:MAG: hypothetical protein ISEC1_P0013 [Thiomicrorhabdus sp.]|nr:MAG: hypothetical protein ISEC1_P0013 [Thiomicrorhabdus sp.]
MKYRSEIDGLRALAILPVIFFHAGFELFSGGYIGVDVFFVISGYLITTIIINEMEQGSFSLANFYERRARRILPALFFVVLACLPFAWMWLSPKEMKDFSESLIGVVTFTSNIIFWTQSGYFDTASELKPLLHTWSLAVEEQYYIFFPLFLITVWRFGKGVIAVTLFIFFILSFGLANWVTYNFPSAAFFHLPARGWELLIGALSAVYLNQYTFISNKIVNQSLSLLGLLLILYAVFYFDVTTPTPSFYTLIPTLGTVLIILAANDGTFVRSLLSTKAFVGIGLISYSAYLWHQPVFVFLRYSSIDTMPFYSYFIALIATFILAWFSWKYIEVPFRKKGVFSRNFIAIWSIIFGTLIISIGYYGYVEEGFELKEPSTVVAVNPVLNEDVFLIGDSHANHLVYGLSQMTTGNITIRSSNGCIPFRNIDRYDFRIAPGTCVNKMNLALDELSNSEKKEVIILSTMGPVYLDASPFNGKDLARVTGLGLTLIDNELLTDRWQIFEVAMRNTLKELSLIKDKKIVFVIDNPELGIDFGCNKGKKELDLFGTKLTDDVKNIEAKNCRIDRVTYDDRASRYKALIYSVAEEFPLVTIFDPTSLFCDKQYCYGYKKNIGYLYQDVDHLSQSGSLYVAKELAKLITKI